MRWLEKDNRNVVIGFTAYKRFYQLTNSQSKSTSYRNFIDSKFYNDFVKFGMWLNDSYIINSSAYIDYVIKNNVKIAKWGHDKTYEAYIRTFILKEHPGNALERSITWMAKYCEENNIALEHFFKSIGPNKLVDILRSAKISPWVLFLSSNQETRDIPYHFDEGQYKLLNNILDPKVWNIKIRKYKSSINEYEKIMEEAGL